ncbi:hypothetical protein E6O75_ATG01517 [Venturia nashicola]|uniref:Uncharacterized protein n=1 Tax=Venturia nashicola TaxID=86259 RepID=A0A4Z1PH65_9PEZI|nr:hypothetical protein E6O75_ATG01517 [Venturia nashicola]
MPLVLIGLPLMAACEYFFRHRTTALAELELLPRRTTEPRPRSSNITVQQKANFNRESYEGSPWFKTSTWLTMIIILGTTVMVLNFVAEQADALNVIRRTLFPVVFTLCFVLFSFGIFAMLAHDIWPEKRSTRWANGFLTFWAIATTAGMLFLAVFIFWSLGSEMSSGYRGSGPDPNTSIAAITIASAAAVFLLYAILCVRAGYLISRKVGAPAYIAV